MTAQDTAAAGATRRDTAFLGHPVGLGWLSASEVWERFSYYGMQTLLVLYMVGSLLHPGHVEHVLGFAPFRHVIESFYGPLSPQALASAIFGLYAGLVYVTPLLGGFLSETFLGRTTAVTAGASLMALGHFLMAFDASFLLALLCLLSGVGLFKGNIAVQVGDLYSHDDPRRADGFQIYFLGIQLAVIASPLVCGTLGELYGWHWGFGAAGVGMVIGLLTYLLGRPTYPPEPLQLKRDGAIPRGPLTGREWLALLVLLAIIPALAIASVGNQEIFNAYLIWGKESYDLTLLGHVIPVTWLITLDAIVSTATMVLVILFWRWWATRWTEPDELTKLIIGVAIGMLAPLVLAAAAAAHDASGHRVSLAWALGFEILNDVGFANIFPVGLALYTRASPRGWAGVMIPIYYLHLFAGNMLVGWLGGQLEKMSAPQFWLLHAALIAGTAIFLVFIRLTVGRALSPAFHKAPAA
jgi:POT family proton-dependent oligopeptide transporter